MRLPIMAGQFYPAQKQKLKFLIKEELKSVKNNIPEPKILILPHAGYSFCGEVMAAGFKQVQNKNINRVIIIAPSHRAFNGICFDENKTWATPISRIKLENKVIENIKNEIKDDQFLFESRYHNYEHSIEVLLPFLEVILDDFKIIPILIGKSDPDKNKKLVSVLKQYINKNTLVIISSDLSHYPNKKIAQREDQKTIASIISGDLEKFNKRLKQPKRFATYACGSEAIKIALRLKKALNLKEGHFIKYQNSGDVSGGNSKVVGYGAISFN